jgi:hypothetical protein
MSDHQNTPHQPQENRKLSSRAEAEKMKRAAIERAPRRIECEPAPRNRLQAQALSTR